jgi:3-methylcrotonyl-CoA carboxylase alpha subunit
MNAEPELRVEVQSGALRQRVSLAADVRAPLSHVQVAGETLVFDRGEAHAFEEPHSLAADADAAADGAIRAPMPGRVIALQVAEGEDVSKGQPLVTVEAMKMEHTLTAPFDGRATGLAHDVGDQVSEGSVLLRIARPAV